MVVTVACLLVDGNIDFLTAQEPSLPLTLSIYEKTFSLVNAEENLKNLEHQYVSLFDDYHEVILTFSLS